MNADHAGRNVSLRIVPWLALLLACPFITTLSASGRPVTFPSTDGVSLSAMLYEASPRPGPAVVLVHMLGRSKDEWAGIAERLQESGVTALAVDLRGHGQSGGNGSELPAMVGDVRAALAWLSSRPSVQPSALAVIGASLGANLAALAASDTPQVRVVVLVSPSLDYRGVRLDAGVMRKLADRAVWMAASTEDPYALRSIRELLSENAVHQQRLSPVRGHGMALLAADQDLAAALVDWLKARLIF
jgi:alpha-beta hydrolase superfamily lysophospholipase